MRNLVPRVLLGLLLAALVVSFTACRNTGYGDFDYVYPAELGSGIIRGTITRTPGLSIRAAVPVPVAGAEVWLEEFPSLKAVSDAQGNYRINGVPAGTFRVVAKYKDNVTVYKMRSTSNTLVEKDDKVVDLGLLTATNIVRGVMTDENGALLPQGTPVYLWGEVFYIGQNGSFETPPLPTFEGLNSIFDLVLNPGQANQFNIPVSFVSAERPLEVIITVPTSGGSSASAMPTVLLVAMKDNAIRTTASPNEQLTVTGVITPADTSNDNLVWSPPAARSVTTPRPTAGSGSAHGPPPTRPGSRRSASASPPRTAKSPLPASRSWSAPTSPTPSPTTETAAPAVPFRSTARPTPTARMSPFWETPEIS